MTTVQSTSTGIVRDAAEVVPFVGMAGRYSLKAPYTALVNPNVEYTCTGVISLVGAIAQGSDPWEEVYLPNGATEAAYALDKEKNHCLVTLQSGLGDVVVVPNSALMALPNADGIRYVNVMLGVSLSAIPEELDLTSLKVDVSDLVFHRLGVRSTVYPAVFGATALIDHDQHKAIEAARLVNIQSNLSTLTENEMLKVQNTALVAKVAMLEGYIKTTLPQP